MTIKKIKETAFVSLLVSVCVRFFPYDFTYDIMLIFVLLIFAGICFEQIFDD